MKTGNAGFRDSRSLDGIQEVAPSIRLSSTNEIKGMSLGGGSSSWMTCRLSSEHSRKKL